MTMLPTFLAGANWVMHSAGWLEGGLVAGYEKFIVDVEILQMLQAEFTPLEIDEASLAFDAHHGGRPRRPLPRRDAHARALPHLLLPADAVQLGQLRAVDAQRRHGRRGPGRRRSTSRSSRSTRRRRSTTRSARSSRPRAGSRVRCSCAHAARDLRRSPLDVACNRRLAVRHLADPRAGRSPTRRTSTRRWWRSWSASSSEWRRLRLHQSSSFRE